MIAANDVAKAGQGFNSEHNALTVFTATEKIDLGYNTKANLADLLVKEIQSQKSL